MKAKLVKIDYQFFLYNAEDDLIATTEESPYQRLSMKNCQAIERGYDLDELASIFMSSGKTIGGGNSGWIKSAFKEGFQKALEIYNDDINTLSRKKEWDVEIEQILIQSSIDSEAIWKHALDKDGCLILKSFKSE